MRPELLYPLFVPVSGLQGVGARIAGLIGKLAGSRVVDLIWHFPTGRIDRRYSPKVAETEAGRIATLTVRVDVHMPPSRPRLPYKVICSDDTGHIVLVFFNARSDYLTKILPTGETRIVSGRIDGFNDEIQMVHPDHVVPPEEADNVRGVEPVYPLTAGLTPRVLAKAVRGAVNRAPDLPEWIDPSLVAKRGWPAWKAALETLHEPMEEDDISPMAPARMRLAYDELLANQLAMILVRTRMRTVGGRSLRGDGHLRRRVLDALPFDLTLSQQRVLDEIKADMANDTRMLRLLQGDVGSGKTIVAVLSMLAAVETGAQAALMAPTEILARQHYGTVSKLAETAGVRVVLLTGREKGKARARILEDIASGETAIVVGTHSLFQEDVDFANLAFAVIDEQHRFGVHQRLALAKKGQAVDILVMTATPIPRTLVLTRYGDMESSNITEKPAGRKPVDTRVLPIDRIGDVVEAVSRALTDGAKIYWVCPLVEESDTSDLAAAEERHADLSGRFGPRVGLVHGRMKGADKDAVMEAFASGDTDILVATTVIEVGVDVPAATVMVIEHAERFGLAQLHQLRGRIGRGEKPSTCLLLYAPPLSEAARSRLSIMRETEDGFRIAEEDLKVRGGGEILGTRQSGMPEFRVADLAVHGELLAIARDDARLALDRDPTLKTPRGEALRVLLYLFDRDSAVGLVRSG